MNAFQAPTYASTPRVGSHDPLRRRKSSYTQDTGLGEKGDEKRFFPPRNKIYRLILISRHPLFFVGLVSWIQEEVRGDGINSLLTNLTG